MLEGELFNEQSSRSLSCSSIIQISSSANNALISIYLYQLNRLYSLGLRTAPMTLCKYECMILSHDGSKILTACRMLQILIAHRQMKAKIHSFPTMYILGGVDVVEMGQIKVFVQELGLKRWFLVDANINYFTSI